MSVDQLESQHILTSEMQEYILEHLDTDPSKIADTLGIRITIVKEFLLSQGITLTGRKSTMRFFNNFSFILENTSLGAQSLSHTLGVSQKDMEAFLLVNDLV